jgi:hypothetical protein
MTRATLLAAAVALGLALPEPVGAATIGYFVWGGGGGRVTSANHILSSTLGEPVASAVDVVSGETVGLTHGYWYYTFCCPSVGVEPPTVPDLPKEFRFYPSAPTPFSAATWIGFDLPAQVTVYIEVFDVRGAHVRTLAAGTYPAGRHRLAWDGADDAGRRRPSGVYLIHARVGDHTYCHKVVKLD